MKRINIMASLLIIGVFAMPALSLANTYQFIDTSGNLRSVEADTSAIALQTASPLAIHSGVALVKTGAGGVVLGDYTSTTGTGNYYQFIDTSGNLQGIWAPNATVALATAYPLAIHSGVVLVK